MNDISKAKPFGFLAQEPKAYRSRPRQWIRTLDSQSTSVFNLNKRPSLPAFHGAFVPTVWGPNPVADLVSATVSATYYPSSDVDSRSPQKLKNKEIPIHSATDIIKTFVQWSSLQHSKNLPWPFSIAQKDFLDCLAKQVGEFGIILDSAAINELKKLLKKYQTIKFGDSFLTLPFHILPQLIWLLIAYDWAERQEGIKVTMHSNVLHLLADRTIDEIPGFVAEHLDAVKYDSSQAHTNFYLEFHIPYSREESTDIEDAFAHLNDEIPSLVLQEEGTSSYIIRVPGIELLARGLEKVSGQRAGQQLEYTTDTNAVGRIILTLKDLTNLDSEVGSTHPFEEALISLISLTSKAEIEPEPEE